MKTRAMAHVAVALLSSTIIIPAVAAQDSDAPLAAVYDRSRADYDAPGIRSGSFLFNPSISVDGKFDSNIYASDGNEVDDFIVLIKPGFSLNSDWNNNAFSFFADAEIGKYADHGTESYEDFNIGMNGRIDITRGSNITASVSYADDHEDRGSPDDIGAPAEITNLSRFNAALGFKRDEGLMSFALDGDYTKEDYDDADLVGGGSLENDDRDRSTVNGAVRLGYHMNDEYEAFVKLTLSKVTYDDSTIEGGPRRDSDGWDIVGGAAFNLTGTAEGEFYVGYIQRHYDAASLQSGNVDDFKFGASILWSPNSGLTSARIAVDRSVVETSLAASGILSTLYSIDLQHELQRNLLLNGKLSYNQMDFKGSVPSRDDDLFSLGLGAKYLMNRHISLTATYDYNKRDTTAVNQDYNRHIFMVGVSAQW